MEEFKKDDSFTKTCEKVAWLIIVSMLLSLIECIIPTILIFAMIGTLNHFVSVVTLSLFIFINFICLISGYAYRIAFGKQKLFGSEK